MVLHQTSLAGSLALLGLVGLAATQTVIVPQKLSPTYYARSCPRAEAIVFNAVRAAVRTNNRLAPQLIRLLFHDCFVQGCEASILLDSLDENPAEKDASPNLTLGGFDFIDNVKAQVEKACPATVSCADIIAMAARDSLTMLGGPQVNLRYGRLDGTTTSSEAVAGRIPDSASNIAAIITLFGTVGLNFIDTVALSGAHTVGKGQCNHLMNRIQFPDNSMSPKFRLQLVRQCGPINRFKGATLVQLDPVTPLKFDNQYYKNILAKAGTFTSDQSMLSDRQTLRLVQVFAQNQNAFFRQFALSFKKMSEIDILGKPLGEVRTNCHLPRALS